MIEHHKVHALTFSSSSAVNAYIKHDVPCGFDKYVAIGAQTANITKERSQAINSDKQTSESLINKIIESWYNNEI